MKVLQATKAFSPHRGGIETVVEQLHLGLPRRAIESAVLCAAPPKTTSQHVHVSRSRQMGTVRSIPLAPMYPIDLCRSRADVLLIHIPSALPEITTAVAWKHLARRFDRVFLWWHSDIIRQRVLKAVYEPAVRRLLKSADGVFVATPHHVSSSALLSESNVPKHVVPYGLNLPDYAELAADFSILQGLRRDRPFLLFIGRLVYYKGVPELLEMARRLPECDLVVVGEGPLSPLVDDLEHETGGRVRRLSGLKRAELVGLMHACSFVVFPSVAESEAFGIVQTEAMACGKPVVAFDLPTGVSWVNRHGATGLLAERGNLSQFCDYVKQLLNDESLRDELGANAKVWAHEEFDEETMLDRVAEVFTPTTTRLDRTV